MFFAFWVEGDVWVLRRALQAQLLRDEKGKKALGKRDDDDDGCVVELWMKVGSWMVLESAPNSMEGFGRGIKRTVSL